MTCQNVEAHVYRDREGYLRVVLLYDDKRMPHPGRFRNVADMMTELAAGLRITLGETRNDLPK